MSEDPSTPPPPPPPPSPPPSGGPQDGGSTQHVPMNRATARIPEKVSKGTFATGVLVFTGPQEFVLDFVQGLARPLQLAARLVVAHNVLEQLVAALGDNYNRYCAAFGIPPSLPKNPHERPRTAEEIYGDIKIPDELLCGAYANTVLIGHSPAEFHLDFITNFYPNPAVSCRVYLAASRVPQVLDTLSVSLNNLIRARQGQQVPPSPGQQQPPPPPAPPQN